MRSELLRSLFEAYAGGDNKKFMDSASEIIKDEEKKKHYVLAKNLKNSLHTKHPNIGPTSYRCKYKINFPIPRDTEKGFPLLEIREYYLNFNDLIIDDEIKDRIKFIIDETKAAEVLKTYGLKPKQKILFCGPPGTGKTLSSKIMSSVIGYPLVQVKFDSIISSFLGETATNLKKIFDFIENGEWIVLFDEFDIIGKQRDDPYEHGEIKRVVNNFMQMLDDYNGKSILIAATNHQYLLDSAIWRRFDDIIYFDLPNMDYREKLFNKYLKNLKRSPDLNMVKYAESTEGLSPSDISQICEEALRRVIIKNFNEIKNNDIEYAICMQMRKRKVMKGEKISKENTNI
jgi:SpoVK/Ycf46/Vps4 family AAA+-type ATPase